MVEIKAAARLNAAAPLNVWRTRPAFGPKAVTLAEAKAQGFTEGPYYHGTKLKRNYAGIMEKGFRSKGAPSWAVESQGEVEEFEKWGTVDPVMFTPHRQEAVAYGGHVVTCYVKPGRAFSAKRLTLAGGLYVKHPADIIPILPEDKA